ncbi:hypothetical protein BDR26DRAFT_858631 [Obelidium mucronatum]|nr:hypothetical protein BDR26DRAFT_858631 [Obelidium mucronatum]
MLALFGQLRHQENETMNAVVLVRYRATEKSLFQVKLKPAPKFRQLEDLETAKATTTATIHINSYKMKKRLKRLKKYRHENVTEFLFAAVSTSSDPKVNPQPDHAWKGRRYASEFYIVMENCSRGTLEDALCGLRFPLPMIVKLSLCRDLFLGLQHIHYHRGPLGQLSARTCYVTDGWRLKIYPGKFTSVAELCPLSNSFDIYEKFASRLFTPPDEIERYPKTFKSIEGDVYSASLLMNMIMCDGQRPFVDQTNLDDLIKRLPEDEHSILRPPLPKECNPKLVKLIQDGWSFYPENRPKISDILLQLDMLLNRLLPRKSRDIELHLSKIYAQEINNYLLELESAQSHLSNNLGEAVTKRLAESEMRVQTIRAEYQRQIDGLKEQLGQTQEHVHIQANSLGMETDQMKTKLRMLEQNVLASRLSLLPDPLSKLLIENVTSIRLSKGDSFAIPDLDVLFRPTTFPNATVMVVSIAGFNRYIQQLNNAPKILIEILKSYYQGIDDAVLACAHQGSGRVYVVERITDAVVLVSGAIERDEKSAASAVDVGVKLIEWATKWDATKFLSGSNARLLLRIGIHTGPVLGGLIGKTPKLLLMGETLNMATMIETTCGVQEMRVSAFTHSQILSSGQDDRFVFEAKEDVDLKQKGKLGVFKVLVDRG